MPASPKRANCSTKFVPLFEFSFTARAGKYSRDDEFRCRLRRGDVASCGRSNCAAQSRRAGVERAFRAELFFFSTL
jgi:hypothetical protein